MYSDVAIIIPSRIGSQRLPEKPLKDIGGKSMVERVALQALASGSGKVYVATDSDKIERVLSCLPVEVIKTSEGVASGTDRVYEAFKKIKNNEAIKYIVNLQGDMPFIEPSTIKILVDFIKNSSFPIATPVAKVGIAEASGESNVKVVADKNSRALYFSRSLIPSGAQEFLYHVGMYAFRKGALEKFVNLEKSYLEKSENLEQLRALENGMEIGIVYVEDVPISVDTEGDLKKALGYCAKNKS